MKRIISVLLVMCLSVCLASCRVESGKAITGDVKQGTQALSADEKSNTAEQEVVQPDDASENADAEADKSDEQDKADAETDKALFVEKVGGVMSDGREYRAEAERFCGAIISGDTETFAEFAGGGRGDEYYGFLKKADITSFTLYPFEFTEERLNELADKYYQYPVAQDNYLVEFDVASSDCEEFIEGKCVYFFGLEMNPISGSLLSVFVPLEQAEEKITISYSGDYINSFINEFSSLYPMLSTLYEGRNYPDSFDFSNHSHLITHLMARCGEYGEPPYTREEINGFIKESFYENKGLDTADFNNGMWTNSYQYAENHNPEKIYGCSWGHGGTSVVYDVVKTEEDGNEKTFTVQLYADYAKVAKAYTLVFRFECVKGKLPCLMLVEKLDETGHKAALLSI